MNCPKREHKHTTWLTQRSPLQPLHRKPQRHLVTAELRRCRKVSSVGHCKNTLQSKPRYKPLSLHTLWWHLGPAPKHTKILAKKVRRLSPDRKDSLNSGLLELCAVSMVWYAPGLYFFRSTTSCADAGAKPSTSPARDGSPSTNGWAQGLWMVPSVEALAACEFAHFNSPLGSSTPCYSLLMSLALGDVHKEGASHHSVQYGHSHNLLPCGCAVSILVCRQCTLHCNQVAQVGTHTRYVCDVVEGMEALKDTAACNYGPA